MAYTVLARRYRSQSFDDVIGQGPIVQTLKNAIKTGRVAHAYLFSGTRGVGKTTMARVLSKALNCLSADAPTVEPCCKCDSCVAINVGEDIDVIEIDGASNNSVDEVRRLRENAIYRPARSRYKIYIIDEVHMLSTSAFNALLKILEEPPTHVKFIFATTEPNKVIPTIQSRCQRFNFNNISPMAIAGQLESVLEKEKIKYEKELILPLARMANGSMRDGLSLLDRLISTGVEPLSLKLFEEFLGCPNSEKISDLVAKIGDSDARGTLETIEDLVGTGLSEIQIADSLIDYMRDLMVVKSAPDQSELVIMTAEKRKRADELAEKFDIAGLIYNITALEKLRWVIKNSQTGRALLEASLLRFALSEHFLNVDGLVSRLQNNLAASKKKTISTNTITMVSSKPVKVADKQQNLFRLNSVELIKDNWQGLLETICAELGNGTGGLLSSAEPARFEDGVLTLTFPASGEISKRMCESNGRKEQIQSLLNRYFSKPVRLEFETADEQSQTATSQSKSDSQNKNDIIKDPAVREVVIGLGATITGIEKDQ